MDLKNEQLVRTLMFADAKMDEAFDLYSWALEHYYSQADAERLSGEFIKVQWQLHEMICRLIGTITINERGQNPEERALSDFLDALDKQLKRERGEQ